MTANEAYVRDLVQMIVSYDDGIGSKYDAAIQLGLQTALVAFALTPDDCL